MTSPLIGVIGCAMVLYGMFSLGIQVESMSRPACTEQTAPPPTL